MARRISFSPGSLEISSRTSTRREPMGFLPERNLGATYMLKLPGRGLVLALRPAYLGSISAFKVR